MDKCSSLELERAGIGSGEEPRRVVGSRELRVGALRLAGTRRNRLEARSCRLLVAVDRARRSRYQILLCAQL